MKRKICGWFTVLAAVLLACSALAVETTNATKVVLFATQHFTGQVLNNPITVTVLNSPWSTSNNLIAGSSISLQPVNGVTATNLVPGDYKVVIQGISKSWTITVGLTTNEVENAAAIPKAGVTGADIFYWTNALAGVTVNVYGGTNSGTLPDNVVTNTQQGVSLGGTFASDGSFPLVLTNTVSGGALYGLNQDSEFKSVFQWESTDGTLTFGQPSIFADGVTGTFTGDGSGLTNLPASGGTGTGALQGVEIIAIGDSLTYRGYGLYPSAIATNQGPEWSAVNKGIDGNLITDLQARFQKDVITPGADYLLMEGGINSIRQGVPDATVQSGLQGMYTWAHTNGIRVIAVNLSPMGGHAEYVGTVPASISNVNWWISNAATNLYAVANAYAYLGDPAAPTNLLTAYDSGDHIHYSTNGYVALVSNIVRSITFTNNGTTNALIVRSADVRLDQSLRKRDIATLAGAAFNLSNGALLQITNVGSGGAMLKSSGALNLYPDTGVHLFWDAGALAADYGLSIVDAWSFPRPLFTTNLLISVGNGGTMQLTNAGSSSGKLRTSSALNLESGTGQFYVLSNGVSILDFNLTTPGQWAFNRTASGTFAGDGSGLTNLPAIGGQSTNLMTVLNVKDWGAVGDGLTDDLTALQAAVNAATSNRTLPGRVFLPTGDYLISGSLRIPPNGNGNAFPYAPHEKALTIFGDGINATRILATSPAFTNQVAIWALATNTAERIDYPHIHDLSILGPQIANWTTDSRSIGINAGFWPYSEATNNQYRGIAFILDRVEVTGFDHAIAATNVWGFTINSGLFKSNRLHHLAFSMTHSANIRDCWFYGQAPSPWLGGPLDSSHVPSRFTGTAIGFYAPTEQFKSFGFGDTAKIENSKVFWCTNYIYNNELSLIDMAANVQGAMQVYWLEGGQWSTNWNGTQTWKAPGLTSMNLVFGDMQAEYPLVWTNAVANPGQIVTTAHAVSQLMLINYWGNVVGFGGTRRPVNVLSTNIGGVPYPATAGPKFWGSRPTWPCWLDGTNAITVMSQGEWLEKAITNGTPSAILVSPSYIVTTNGTAGSTVSDQNPGLAILAGGNGQWREPGLAIGANIGYGQGISNNTVKLATISTYSYSNASPGFPDAAMIGSVSSNGATYIGLGSAPFAPAFGGYATNETANGADGYGKGIQGIGFLTSQRPATVPYLRGFINSRGGVTFGPTPDFTASVGTVIASNYVGSGSGLTNLPATDIPNAARATNFSMWGSGPADGVRLWYSDEQLVYTAGTWYFRGGVDFSGAEVEGLVGVTSVASTVPLAARGTTAQSTNLFQLENSSSNVVASVTSSGVFTGNGSGLTNLPASALVGTLTNVSHRGDTTIYAGGVPVLAALQDTPNTLLLGGIVASTNFTGDGGGLTNLNASELRSGTVSEARLPVSRGVAFAQTNTLSIYGSTNVGTTGLAVYPTNSATPILWAGPVTAASNPWRVGIGNSSPSATLDVTGTTKTTALTAHNLSILASGAGGDLPSGTIATSAGNLGIGPDTGVGRQLTLFAVSPSNGLRSVLEYTNPSAALEPTILMLKHGGTVLAGGVISASKFEATAGGRGGLAINGVTNVQDFGAAYTAITNWTTAKTGARVGISTANGTLTITNAGTYWIYFQAECTGSGTATAEVAAHQGGVEDNTLETGCTFSTARGSMSFGGQLTTTTNNAVIDVRIKALAGTETISFLAAQFSAHRILD